MTTRTGERPIPARSAAPRFRIIKTVPARRGLERWGAILASHLRSLIDLDVAIDLVEVPGIELDEIADLADCHTVAPAQAHLVSTLLTGEDPPDAVALGCLLEPGFDELTDAAGLITGEIESCLRLLATPSHPVGVVAGSASAARGVEARVERHGLGALVHDVRAISANPLRFTDEGAQTDLAAAMAAEVRVLAEQGVTQVIGYGSASLLAEVTRRGGVPTHSPVTASLRATAGILTARSR